jgi:hypothetical protein
MYVRSTGLGRTLLKSRLGKLEVTNIVPSTLEESENEPARMLMVMNIDEPVNWEVKAFMEPQDLRRLIMLILRPSVIWGGLKLLFSKHRESVLETDQNTQTKSTSSQKKTSPDGKKERPRANVTLSPAQKAALKKKNAKKQALRSVQSC